MLPASPRCVLPRAGGSPLTLGMLLGTVSPWGQPGPCFPPCAAAWWVPSPCCVPAQPFACPTWGRRRKVPPLGPGVTSRSTSLVRVSLLCISNQSCCADSDVPGIKSRRRAKKLHRGLAKERKARTEDAWENILEEIYVLAFLPPACLGLVSS